MAGLVLKKRKARKRKRAAPCRGTRFKAMTDIKGDRLCENLGASQVRRRLKGTGFGVRKDRAAFESKLPDPRLAMYPLNMANVRF